MQQYVHGDEPVRQLTTVHFGRVDYTDEQVITFPEGLPAFEQETMFLIIERPATAPVVFLQSLRRPELVFITLPVLLVDPTYRLELAPEDLRALELPDDRQPEIGRQVLCLAIVTVSESRQATANLMAPVVINPKTRRAFQLIQPPGRYSHQHPLQTALATEDPCS